MLLGCKIQPELFDTSDKYREYILKFDVLYVNSWIYYDLDKLDTIYKFVHDNGKEMYGYYLLSSRWATPKLSKFNIKEIKEYVSKIIRRYPLINVWELCHEAINDIGENRKGNKYYRTIGVDWETIAFNMIKNQFPDKKFYYSDYIRNKKKADRIINWINNTNSIDGFNFQCHTDIANPLSSELIRYIYKSINKDVVSLENIVWQLRPSEINPRLQPKELIRAVYKKRMFHLMNIKPEFSENIQAYRYKKYKTLAKNNNVKVFGIWCLTDIFPDNWNHHIWQCNPGLLDAGMKPKKCYDIIFS